MSDTVISPTMDNLWAEVDFQISSDAVNPINRAFFNSLSGALGNNEVVTALNTAFLGRELLRDRDPMASSYVGNYVLRAVHHDLMQSLNGYTSMSEEELSDPDFWNTPIENTTADRIALTARFMTHETQSNKPERYKSWVLARNLFPERFQGSANVLDIGPSVGLGLKHLALKRPFAQVTSPFSEHAEIVNEHLLFQDPEVDDIYVGIDRMMQREGDTALSSHARSDSIPPHEMVKKGTLEAYDELDKQKPANVNIVIGDVSAEPDKFREYIEMEEYGLGEFDAVILSTILYQIGQDVRERTFENVKSMLDPNGAQLAVVNEHANLVDGDGLQAIKPRDSGWYDPNIWPYRTYVVDFRHGGKVTELAKYRDGRCGEVILSGRSIEKFNTISTRR